MKIFRITRFLVLVFMSMTNLGTWVAVAQDSVLIGLFDSWSYNQSGANLGTDWREMEYDDSAWPKGKGVLAWEDNSAVTPLTNTILSLSNPMGERIITYYFRKQFYLADVTTDFFLVASNLVDDGAIVYLNGQELYRLNMPDGCVGADTFASVSATEGVFISTNLSRGFLLPGMNVLAVEVHQVNLASSDVVFGFSLTGKRGVMVGVPQVQVPPQSQFTAPGGKVLLQVSASGQQQLTFQWRKDGAALTNSDRLQGTDSDTLVIGNLQYSDTGSYQVFVRNALGMTISSAAVLAVDHFSRIATGAMVNDNVSTLGCSWGDYDHDGYEDLFVARDGGGNFLYRNNGNGTFTKMSGLTLVQDGANSSGVAWADYDNDGNLDLYVGNLSLQTNFLYHNNGNGTFARIQTGPLVTEHASSRAVAWGDYDNDGYVDLFVSHRADSYVSYPTNSLYHNNGNGTFTKITTGNMATDIASCEAAAWGDFDNDGLLDLFVSAGNGGNNILYRNLGHGAFSRVTTGSIVSDGGDSRGCAWGDYDNDGYLDLFVCNTAGNNEANFLYHNNGDGTFTRITTGAIATDLGASIGCAWGDYDNDGFLELFVSRNAGQTNALYHNNGDGTFTRVLTGCIANTAAVGHGCAWADYDQDGQLDLFVANWAGWNDYLYHNNGTTNNWIEIRCIGLQSNRAAIGAKIRLTARFRGAQRTQLREISGGSGFGSQNSLVQHFGLAEATNVEMIRVEWPLGQVTLLANMAANQIYTITEGTWPIPGPKLFLPPDAFRIEQSGGFKLLLGGPTGQVLTLEYSTDLFSWYPLRTFTNTSGVVDFLDGRALEVLQGFYRTRTGLPFAP